MRALPSVCAAVFIASCGPASPGHKLPDKPARDQFDRTTDVAAGSDLPTPQATPLAGDAMAVTIHRLSNGLTVYISPNHDKPRISAWIAVRAGSRHDPANSTGLAHYLEHMMFKGTSKMGTLDVAGERPHLDRIASLYAELRKASDPDARTRILASIDSETQATAKYSIPNEIDQLYAGLGIQGVNAFTSDETTVYVTDVPSNRFAAWVEVEAERFAAPEFRLFYPELETVYEEKNSSLDSPQSRVFTALARTMYPTHPYGTQPTIGLIDHLKSPAYEDMVEYFRTWYVPNNMAILLAGDITPAAAIPVLEAAFSRLEPRPLPSSLHGSITPLAGRMEDKVEAPGEESIYLSWRTAPANHVDRDALDVMDLIADNATSGLINVDLVLPQNVLDAGSFSSGSIESGSWTMTGTARSGQTLDEVEKLLLGVVAKLKSGTFTQSALDAVVTNEEIDAKRQLESNDSRVSVMASAFVHHTPWDMAANRLERLARVSRDDVIRVANKYLGDDLVVIRRTQGEYEPPKIDKPTITPIKIDSGRQSAFARRIRALPVTPLDPEWLVEGEHYTRHALPAGGLIAVKNSLNDLFQLTYRFGFGERKQRLLCHALDLLERAGTATLDAARLQATLYRMGTAIDVRCSQDEVTITVTGLDSRLEQSVKLLDAWLRTARFSDDDLAKQVATTVKEREDAMAEPSVIGRALSAYATYGKSSHFLTVPRNRDLKRATRRTIETLLSQLLDHAHRTTYFGPRPVQNIAPIVALGANHRVVRPRPPVRYRRAKRGVQAFFVAQKVTQAQVRFAFPRPPLDVDRRILSRLYTEYVGGGMGSLVFQEIREARGLAYTAWAVHSGGQRINHASALRGGIGTQVDKTPEAVQAMLGLLRTFKVTSQRFTIAVEAVDQEFRAARVAPRWTAAEVEAWDDLGLTADPRPAQWQALRSIDEARLQAFAQGLVAGGVIVSVMADSARLDQKATAKALSGRLRTVRIDQLANH